MLLSNELQLDVVQVSQRIPFFSFFFIHSFIRFFF
jgi:hypothetical protein